MKKIFTRKSILSLFLLMLIIGVESLFAQVDTSSINKVQGGKNLIQINLPAILLKNYSLVYQRAVAKKIAVGLGIRYSAESELPFRSQFADLLDEETKKQIDNFRTGNVAFTPEVRFYMGKSVFRGFYIAPFARYAKYDAKLPFNYDYEHPVNGPQTNNIQLNGDLTTITGGILFGAQWKLSKLVYLDWWMLGPQYGTSDGTILGKQALSSEEQTALRDELKNLEDLPLVDVTSEVRSDGATVNFKGPWAGVRAGICLGFRF